MSSLSIGLSALTANQRLLDLTGQNIANANTAGYHRQVAELAARYNGSLIGSGVDVTRINRLVNTLVEQSVNSVNGASGNVSTQLSTMSQIQTLLNPTDGSLNDLLQKFFDQANQLSAQPADITQRRVFLATASSLADGINGLAHDLGAVQDGLQDQMAQVVDAANPLIAQIADLNGRIQSLSLQQTEPNDLKDQRDQLISKLSSIVNIQTLPEDNGQVGVIAGSVPVVLGNTFSKIEMYNDPATNTPAFRLAGSTTPLTLTGGQLAGLVTMRNQTLPNLSQQLDALTAELVRGLDQIHATSIPLTGPFGVLGGQHGVTKSTIPLAQAGLAFAPQAGTLYVSVTNNVTGVRTQTALTIDPATQSLQDIANALSGIPNLQAQVDSQTQTLRISAKPGFSFDFAGQLPTAPSATAITGTATAQLAGAYSGASNDQYTFNVVGSGTVGVTAGLSLEVRNSAGSLLGTFNIGQGYTANSVLQTVNGVSVKLSAGTLNSGDSFGTAVVANSDSGGLLSALGLNSFFQGAGAGNLAVRQDLLANPQKLALSQSGQPADGTGLLRIGALADAPVLANGTQSLQQFLAGMIGDTGSQVADLTQQQSAQQVVAQRLASQQQSLSGVDANEELVKLMQFQRSFQAAAKYVSVVDQTLADLFQMM